MAHFRTVAAIADAIYPRSRYYFDHPSGGVGFKTEYGYDWWVYIVSAGGYVQAGSSSAREGATKRRFQFMY